MSMLPDVSLARDMKNMVVNGDPLDKEAYVTMWDTELDYRKYTVPRSSWLIFDISTWW